MTIIALASTKGGVGKTTSAVALASALANFESTCLVDFDSQGQVASHFGLPRRSDVYNWLSGELPIFDCLVRGRGDGLMLLLGDSMTKGVYQRMIGREVVDHVAMRLRTLPFPFVVVDTAAGGLLQEAAMSAAEQIIIPFRPEKPSIDAVWDMMELCRQLAPNAYLTLLCNGYDLRVSEHRLNLAEMAVKYEALDFGLHADYAIRNRIAVAEAVAQGCTIWEYESSGLRDVRMGYSHLARRVLVASGYDGSNAEILEAISHGKAA